MNEAKQSELLATIIDLRQTLQAIIRANRWELPDGSIATYSLPVTAAEAADDCEAITGCPINPAELIPTH